VATWCIVVAGGRGSRFAADRPKQYEALGDRRLLDWSLAAAKASCDGVVLVVPEDRRADPEPAADVIVAGGATRSDSVRAGLAAVPVRGVDVILVHDAARPLASAALFERVITAVRDGADGAIPCVAVTDTLKRLAGELVVETVDRDDLVAVQTPQGFRADLLRRAHQAGATATDDAALVEALGGRVVAIPGEDANRKVTTPADLAWAATQLS
jgi:2-C-methyl-D-erythritol 4-phosphate cytidylyltransferase